MQWQRQRLRQTPPPLYCTADVILLSVPPGDYSPGRGARQCTMWRYKRGRGPSSCPRGACKCCGCMFSCRRPEVWCREVQGSAGRCTAGHGHTETMCDHTCVRNSDARCVRANLVEQAALVRYQDPNVRFASGQRVQSVAGKRTVGSILHRSRPEKYFLSLLYAQRCIPRAVG